MKSARKSIREPDKQRILDAINHIERKDIPMLEVDPDMSLVEKILEKKMPYSLHSYEMEPDDNVELSLRMGNDMVYFGHLWRVGRKEKIDVEGRIHYIDGTIKSRGDFKSISYPDLDELERKLEKTCKLVDSKGPGILCVVQSGISTAFTAMGPNDFLLNTLMDPNLLKDLISFLHEHSMKELEMFLKYPVDMMRVTSRLNTHTGPLVSRELINELETPFLKEQVNTIKDKNKIAFFHIDGNVWSLIPGIIEMGIDVLNPIDPSGGLQDIFEIKKEWGDRITLCGNIDVDSILMNGTPDEVKENVIYHMKILGRGGGYIVASSHDLHKNIPIDNFYAMRDAVAGFSL